MKKIYEALRANTAAGRQLSSDVDWDAYLRSLPDFTYACDVQAHQPLFAWISSLANPRPVVAVSHVLVDEAQDVMPIEWLVLDEINVDDHWTILGDLNQRRSDHSLHAWKHLADVLGIFDEEDSPPVVRLERGYRSTAQIIRYADRLLARGERGVTSLQTDGTEPRVLRCSQSDLPRTVLGQAEDLRARINQDGRAHLDITAGPVRGPAQKGMDCRSRRPQGVEERYS